MALGGCLPWQRKYHREIYKSLSLLAVFIIVLFHFNQPHISDGILSEQYLHTERETSVKLSSSKQSQPYPISLTPRQYVSALALVREGLLTPSHLVSSPGAGHLAVGMIVVGTRAGFLAGLGRELDSILTFSAGAPLHLVVITDSASRARVARCIGGTLARCLLVHD
jgi:hypothetical protein